MSFILCVVLCAMFRLIVVLFCVMCVICLLCLVVLPLPPDKNPFAVKINNYNSYYLICSATRRIFLEWVKEIKTTKS
jgi:type IV secretory pathway component VirB8